MHVGGKVECGAVPHSFIVQCYVIAVLFPVYFPHRCEIMLVLLVTMYEFIQFFRGRKFVVLVSV